jgi:hypothetical protein
MRLTTFNNFLTGKKTWLIASKGKCGHKGYVEYQIMLTRNTWLVYKTDGYKLDYLASYDGDKSIKSVLNLVWGR